MAKNKTKEKHMKTPIERHETAAWDNAVKANQYLRLLYLVKQMFEMLKIM